MNNKMLGTQFEREMVQHLADTGWWVHFISPDRRGAQPFDIIALKAGKALAIDCKTSSRPIFYLERLEYNQICAFDKWIEIVQQAPWIAVKYQDKIYMVPYSLLKLKGKVDLNAIDSWR
jgi:Holliday junction resolvase